MNFLNLNYNSNHKQQGVLFYIIFYTVLSTCHVALQQSIYMFFLSGLIRSNLNQQEEFLYIPFVAYFSAPHVADAQSSSIKYYAHPHCIFTSRLPTTPILSELHLFATKRLTISSPPKDS